ncbi:pyroglutamyl-peptidase I [Rheinheimera sp.]|uniref:pyroglutamyl-peptidase I n=1 Tax=Rheinheimera sp. TaxID=1869214 RepID=UPI00307E0082
MATVLLTGFEPFGGEPINPSWQAVQALDAVWLDDEVQIRAVQLPCTFADSLQTLEQNISRFKPALVLCLGQAGGRTDLSFEKVAINHIDARIADNAGAQPIDQPVIAQGPAAYFSTLPLKAMVSHLHQAGFAASISYSAGTFVCNQVFYGLMHLLQNQPQVRGGFLHIPYSPAQVLGKQQASMSPELVVQALKVCLPVALQTEQDWLIAGGTLD